MLHEEPPEKIAPASTPDYTLVMIEAGADRQRMVRALCRVNNCSESAARALLGRPMPVVVNADLSYGDAALGQFELVCCDALSVIIPSEVVANAEPSYLGDLLTRLRQSDEFQQVTLRLERLPAGEAATRFLRQFLGLSEAECKAPLFPLESRMCRKKARIMAHWGHRIRAELKVVVDPRDK
ncbi:MAG: hypothetical protein FJ276_18795 [Planctomycetes bacterium]|nr:hypothetical protein [Planctomycetota bacterium]